MKIEIDLTHEQLDELIIKDLKWHAQNCEELEYSEALKKVLYYYNGGKDGL